MSGTSGQTVYDSINNGKTTNHDTTNGTATPKVTATNSNRKDRRKEWWDKKNKMKTPVNNERRKSEGKVAEMKKSPEDGSDHEALRTKLRKREAIAKPDSLKYEPDFSRGFHSKIMENLYIEPSKKEKKRKKKKKQDEVVPKSAKRKITSTSESPEDAKRLKTTTPEQPEVFDSYKFSLNLINGEVDTTKNGKESKNKYVLFIGNLPYDITREQLEEHFRKTGGIKSIRIPREKGTEKGRGFAYMEFDGRISHGIALRLHQTTLGGRKINVEFTSIGGGKSEARKEKLRKKNIKRRKMKMY